MPVITAFPDLARAYVRVEIDWADTPSVTHARVLRVDAVTGECVPLRPYVCFDGDYLELSCGHGIFWDTEVPLDRQVYYITEGLGAPCIPVATNVVDLFERLNVDTWSMSTSGDVWTTIGGIAADYDVDGSRGTHSLTSVNVARRSIIGDNLTTAEVMVDVAPTQLSLGAAFRMTVLLRFTSVADFYMTEIIFGNFLIATIRKSVAGVFTTLATTTPIFTYVPTSVYTVRFRVSGTLLLMKIWEVGTDEPATWTLTATDTSLPGPGQGGVRSIRDVGNTNIGLAVAYDNFYYSEPCLPCTETTATSESLTVASGGAFRLKDPVRPCNDIRVPLCFEQTQQDPNCVPGSGIFFASVDTETRDSNSIVLNPTNASLPLAVNRRRRGVTSVLTLVTRTFADRDDLLNINDPGSALLLQGPPQYGVKDQYISVGDLSVDRGLIDHKFPIRVNSLPYVQVKRPAGPSTGVCGSRMEDLCDVYPTWGGIIGAGLAWDDLVRGHASQDAGAIVADARTYDEVNAEFASYNAVNTAGRTYMDLQAGN